MVVSHGYVVFRMKNYDHMLTVFHTFVTGWQPTWKLEVISGSCWLSPGGIHHKGGAAPKTFLLARGYHREAFSAALYAVYSNIQEPNQSWKMH